MPSMEMFFWARRAGGPAEGPAGWPNPGPDLHQLFQSARGPARHSWRTSQMKTKNQLTEFLSRSSFMACRRPWGGDPSAGFAPGEVSRIPDGRQSESESESARGIGNAQHSGGPDSGPPDIYQAPARLRHHRGHLISLIPKAPLLVIWRWSTNN